MTHEDLVKFEKEVAGPRQREILQKTKVQEGTRFLMDLKVSILDGRCNGVDSRIEANGLVYENGEVKKYHYEEMDVTTKDFVDAHKDYKFAYDAVFELFDEIEELQLSTVIRSTAFLEALYPELKSLRKMDVVDSWEWIKMEFMYNNDIREDEIAQM